jgi:hypothetical protein
MARTRKSNSQRGPSPNAAGKEPTTDAATVAHVSGGTVAVLRAVPATAPPNPEVRERAARRRFTAEYKLRILREADAGTSPGRARRAAAPGRVVLVPSDNVAAPAGRGRLERAGAEETGSSRHGDVTTGASEILGIPLKNLDDAGSDG